jgi:hypothetical protein
VSIPEMPPAVQVRNPEMPDIIEPQPIDPSTFTPVWARREMEKAAADPRVINTITNKLLNAIKHGIHVGGSVIIYLYNRYIEIADGLIFLFQSNPKIIKTIIAMCLITLTHKIYTDPNKTLPWRTEASTGRPLINEGPSWTEQTTEMFREMIADARRIVRNNPIYPLEYHPSTTEPIYSESSTVSIPYDTQLLPTVLQSIAIFSTVVGLMGGATILSKK